MSVLLLYSFCTVYQLTTCTGWMLHRLALACCFLTVTCSLPCGFSNVFMNLGFLPQPRDKLLVPGRNLAAFTHSLSLAQTWAHGHHLTHDSLILWVNNWSGSLFPTPEQGTVIFIFSFETSLQICLKEERDRGKQAFILTWIKKSDTHGLTVLAFPHLSPSAAWQGRAQGCLAGGVHRFLISQGQESDFSLLLSSSFSAPPSFPNYFDWISKTRASFFCCCCS